MVVLGIFQIELWYDYYAMERFLDHWKIDGDICTRQICTNEDWKQDQNLNDFDRHWSIGKLTDVKRSKMWIICFWKGIMMQNCMHVHIDLVRRSISNHWDVQWRMFHFSIKLLNNVLKRVGTKWESSRR